jgi:integrase
MLLLARKAEVPTMPNYKTVALTDEQYATIIRTMREGFEIGDMNVEPNERVATILTLEANLGLRVGDILRLRLNDIIRDGNRLRLDITEEKTGKQRTFTVPHEVYSYICDYATKNNIQRTANLFPITERAVQKHLKKVTDYLKLSKVSTHSFRKYFATRIYENNNYNVVMVQKILQHSTAAVTQKYIGIQQRDIEEALTKNVRIV